MESLFMFCNFGRQIKQQLSLGQYWFARGQQLKMKKAIKEKYQLIDDDSAFRIEELEGLTKENNRIPSKQYQIISIIGSQSSGKSSLLNSLFHTEFEVLNRKRRVGQTTKGIWYSVDTPTSIIIVDVEGSDSNEREERTKIERRNSLFALAISHTLIINLWIQQIGLYKGSQLAILEIILEINLKLFGSERPKQIIFVVRDYVEKEENAEALKVKLFSKVQSAWALIAKPPGKEHIQLKDLFDLKAFFLPHKIEEKEEFEVEAAKLRKFLIENTKNKELTKDNVPVQDLSQYMKNLWETIEADKDINLPQEKILLSNMRCQEIKQKIMDEKGEELRDQLEKSERKMNENFVKNLTKIVGEVFRRYDDESAGYIKEEVSKVRGELEKELDGKIELSFRYQIGIISDECLKTFSEEVNRIFLKDKNIQAIKSLKPRFLQEFNSYLQNVSYKPEWSIEWVTKFHKDLDIKFQFQKEKIVVESLKDFDRSIKKQIQNMVSHAFYDHQAFTMNFWKHVSEEFHVISKKAENSIKGLSTKLELKDGKGGNNRIVANHIERAKCNAKEELRTIIEMKCHDLLYYVMRHFASEFNMDQKVPRHWPDLTQQQIDQLFQDTKNKYLNLVESFITYELDEKSNLEEGSGQEQKKLASRQLSQINPSSSDELVKMKEMLELKKKMGEQMNNVYDEAVKKHKQVYSGSIPLWGWILFAVVAIDDILLWLSSPLLAIPITLLLLVIVVVFLMGGRTLIDKLFGSAKGALFKGLTEKVLKSD